jgi:hypothetical protein
MGQVITYIAVVSFALAMAAWGFYREHTRRQMWRRLAARYGLRYHPRDPFALLDQYTFALFNKGYGKKVTNTLDGRTNGMDVVLFDYCYIIGSGKHRRVERWSGLMVQLPVSGALHIRPETFLDRIGAFLGGDDYNFEYERFNRTFRVSGPDKKFAYDICHAEMMEYLLEQPDQCWEIQGDALLLYSSSLGRFDPEEVAYGLKDARGFLDRLPSYLNHHAD